MSKLQSNCMHSVVLTMVSRVFNIYQDFLISISHFKIRFNYRCVA